MSLNTSELCVKHKNIVLENVISEKLLGVTIDNHLSWKAHIDDLASSLSNLIALFRRTKIYLPLETRILFYKTFFQSRIDFCCTVWRQSPHVSRIYKLQKLLLRLIYDKCSSHCHWCLNDRPEALQTWICGSQITNYQSVGVDLNILEHIFTICCHQRYDLQVHFLHSSEEQRNCF